MFPYLSSRPATHAFERLASASVKHNTGHACSRTSSLWRLFHLLTRFVEEYPRLGWKQRRYRRFMKQDRTRSTSMNVWGFGVLLICVVSTSKVRPRFSAPGVGLRLDLMAQSLLLNGLLYIVRVWFPSHIRIHTTFMSVFLYIHLMFQHITTCIHYICKHHPLNDASIVSFVNVVILKRILKTQ